MTSLLRRRQFLQLSLGAAASAAAAGCITTKASAPAETFAAPATPLFVDIHCHVFNAQDLSPRGFIDHVIAHVRRKDHFFDPVGEIVERIANTLAYYVQ